MRLIWKAKETVDLDALMLSSVEEQLEKEQAANALKVGSKIDVDDDTSSLGITADGDIFWKRPAA